MFETQLIWEGTTESFVFEINSRHQPNHHIEYTVQNSVEEAVSFAKSAAKKLESIKTTPIAELPKDAPLPTKYFAKIFKSLDQKAIRTSHKRSKCAHLLDNNKLESAGEWIRWTQVPTELEERLKTILPEDEQALAAGMYQDISNGIVQHMPACGGTLQGGHYLMRWKDLLESSESSDIFPTYEGQKNRGTITLCNKAVLGPEFNPPLFTLSQTRDQLKVLSKLGGKSVEKYSKLVSSTILHELAHYKFFSDDIDINDHVIGWKEVFKLGSGKKALKNADSYALFGLWCGLLDKGYEVGLGKWNMGRISKYKIDSPAQRRRDFVA